MKFQAFNPYLPSWEYIPDAEPHVFGDRLYVYGSHDRFDGPLFCMNDYVCWSAPIDDLSQWRFEGTIYKKDQDPHNKDSQHAVKLHCQHSRRTCTNQRTVIYFLSSAHKPSLLFTSGLR